MALETATYIDGLVATNPLGTDAKSQGDDHIRLLKATLLATFPNITGALTATHTELNYVDGVTSAIQTQIDTKGAITGQAWTGNHTFPTQTAADNSTKAATTAYVDAADALKANLASPALTGTPTAPTASPGTNTTQLATTAFATQLAFQAALPVQTGEAGKYLRTDGSAASWEDPIASQAEAEAGTANNRLMTPLRTAQATNPGPTLFGDGSLGDATITGATSLSADAFYRNLSFGPAGALDLNGWRLFVAETLDLTGAPAGAITCSVTATAQTAGVGASTSGAAGQNGGQGGSGGVGGAGGNGGAAGTAGATSGTPTPALRQLVRTALTVSDLSSTLALGGSAGGAGGNGGSGGGGDGSGGSGGAFGRGGAVCPIFARTINRDGTTAAAAIEARGQDGGAGGNGTATYGAGGGGGGGGGGGQVTIVCRNLAGSTAANAIDVTGGSGGAGGDGTGGGVGGRGGSSGPGGRLTLAVIGQATLTDTLSSVTANAAAAPSSESGTAGAAATAARFNL
jgi:hypothetical protein